MHIAQNHETITFILFVSLLEVGGSLNNVEIQHSEFVANVIEKECTKNYLSAIVVRLEGTSYCDSVIAQVEQRITLPMVSVFLKDSRAEVQGKWFYRPDIFIICLGETTLDEMFVDDILYFLENLPIWTVRSKFFVFAEKQPGDIENWFGIFAERKIYKVLVCVSISSGVNVYGYNPFKEDFEVFKLKRGFQENGPYFKQLIMDMEGYPIRFFFVDYIQPEAAIQLEDGSWVGRDGLIMYLLTKTLNATIDVYRLSQDFSKDLVMSADPGGALKEYEKAIAEIYDFDMYLTTMESLAEYITFLDQISQYQRYDIVVLAPVKEALPRYLLILTRVPLEFWALELFSLLSISLATRFVSRGSVSVADAITGYVAYLLGSSAPPRRESENSERLLLVIWAFQSLTLGTLFHSLMLSTFVASPPMHRFETLDDLIQNKVVIRCSMYQYLKMQTLFGNDSEDLVMKQFFKLLSPLPSEATIYGTDSDWVMPLLDGESALFLPQEIALSTLLSPDVKKYHIVREIPLPIQAMYSIRRSKPYYEETLFVMGRVEAAGLWNHWRKHFYFQHRNKNTSQLDDRMHGEETMVLNLEHLQAGFMLLLFGYFIATVAFVGELVFKKFLKKKTV